MGNEPACSCCGVEKWRYNRDGHDKECIWYEEEMYRLIEEWLKGPEYENHPFKKDHDDSPMILRADWKRRYNLAVYFLLDQIKAKEF